MQPWKHKIAGLAALWSDVEDCRPEAMEALGESVSDRLTTALKSVTLAPHMMEDLEDIAEDFRYSVDCRDGFNSVLGSLYDAADAYRIWIEPAA